jgi:hypothetical protein
MLHPSAFTMGWAAVVALACALFVALQQSDWLFDALFLAAGELAARLLPHTVEALEPLDYADDRFWSGLPWTDDRADGVPDDSGLRDAQAEAVADVFFVSPTGYFGWDWNAPVLEAGANVFGRIADHLAGTMLMVHATPFNGVARVFAPRYRQMSGYGYLSKNMEARQQAEDQAFRDVLHAFRHYLAKWNAGRPLILVGHSQGSYLLARLLREASKVGFADGLVPLASKLVAAYLLGAALRPRDVPIPVCAAPEETGCVIGYNAFEHGGEASNFLLARSARMSEEETKEIICVNPLTWRLDGLAAPASSNLGSRPIRAIQGWRTGRFMGELRPGLFSAQCADGVLWTEAPAESGFSQSVFPGRNHHGAESSFFFLAHRANAELRLRAFQGEGV